MEGDQPMQREGEVRSITRILDHASGGDRESFAMLIEAAYDDLRRISERQMRRAFRTPSLDGLTRPPTEVMHGAVLRLMKQKCEYANRGHFFAIATKLIVREIADYQRERMAEKRGGGDRGASLEAVDTPGDPPDTAVWMDLVDALSALEEEHARPAEVASLKLFGDLDLPRIGRVIGVSTPTVERDWRFARAFLKLRLGSDV